MQLFWSELEINIEVCHFKCIKASATKKKLALEWTPGNESQHFFLPNYKIFLQNFRRQNCYTDIFGKKIVLLL